MSLLARNLPKVSREFALELKQMFPPITLGAGIDRDKLMISIGEQRVIQKVLHVSSNRIVSSKEEDIKPDNKEDTDNTVAIIMESTPLKKSWFNNFTTRTAT
jgi:hypothetical protein